jgi:hypothetical protein
MTPAQAKKRIVKEFLKIAKTSLEKYGVRDVNGLRCIVLDLDKIKA